MALADPQTVTVNTVAKTLNLVQNDGLLSVYKTDDDTFFFKVSHQDSNQRTRRMVRLDMNKIAADPLTAENQKASAGVYVVIDEPSNGVFTDTELGYLAAALVAWLTSTNVGKVLSGQH
jgi:hypothetical protein